MGTSVRRRLRDGLVGMSVLACAGTLVPVAATAAPAPTPVQPTEAVPSARTRYAMSGSPFSVTVSPARLAVGQDALGTSQPVTVVNRGQEPVSLEVQKRNFVTQPDGGLDYQPDAPYGAADWVHLSRTHLDLQPGTSEQVQVTFDVPAEPEPGDHQVALIFLAPAGRDAGNIKVSRGIGAPVYVTVPGPTDDSVRLNSLEGPRWSWMGKPTLTARLTSTGTVHRDFRGPTALAVGTSGHLTRFDDFTVSRGSDRVVSTPWDAPLACVCHPRMTVTNADGVPQTMSTRVVVLPWWLPAGLLLAALVGLGLVLRSRHRRGRRRRRAASSLDGAGG